MTDRLCMKDEVEDLIRAHAVLKDRECEQKIAKLLYKVEGLKVLRTNPRSVTSILWGNHYGLLTNRNCT
uniref:Uncharacterized protein n=1 Tax=viral metagenome TaxID=1070528 RepID=A0A6H2A4L8_9ZZZZ